MADWESCDAVERHPDIVSGVWVFVGTRVPICALFENLRVGASLEDFLNWFQGVDRWKAGSRRWPTSTLLLKPRFGFPSRYTPSVS